MIQPTGYLKLHRELYHKPIWKQSTPEQKVVLMTLLAMAWFKPNEWEWKGKKFKTVPGQFITSLDSIVIDCGKGISIQNVRSSLKRFEKLEFLTNESTKTGRLITIANWSVYQPKEDNPTKLSTKTQQRGNKEVTPKEEGNKERMKEYTDNEDLLQTLVDYEAMRKTIKKPMTLRALNGILNKLDKLASTDEHKISILEQSIEKCYTGVFEVSNGYFKTEQQNEQKQFIDLSKVEVFYGD